MDDLVAVGSRLYFSFLMLLLVSRGADFLSSWIAMPNLVLAGTPLATMPGWKWGSITNLLISGVLAAWPIPAILIGTPTRPRRILMNHGSSFTFSPPVSAHVPNPRARLRRRECPRAPRRFDAPGRASGKSARHRGQGHGERGKAV